MVAAVVLVLPSTYSDDDDQALAKVVPATVVVGLLATAGCIASCCLCAASRAQSPRGTCCRSSVAVSSMPMGARAGRTTGTDASTPLLSAADVV